ncbi:MAG: hypothetical protein IPP38_12330 [Bacteroidetes bacterium]|nr:hypothetical protein [Bacteroidota bacterium]
MAKKNQMTTCSALEWADALKLIEYLKATEEYRFTWLAGFGFYSGLRISDILSLRWNQILNCQVLDVREREDEKNS